MKFPDLTHDFVVSKAGPMVDACGVYFLILRKRVVYVGQSTDLHKRLYDHVRRGEIYFDSYTFLRCAPELRHEIEAHYIKKFDPANNYTSAKKQGQRKNSVAIVTPLGYFATIADAAAMHGISRVLVMARINRGVLHWARYSEVNPHAPKRAKPSPNIANVAATQPAKQRMKSAA